jgi:predicted  nucleic acid-binding Zn-ribbon protein
VKRKRTFDDYLAELSTLGERRAKMFEEMRRLTKEADALNKAGKLRQARTVLTKATKLAKDLGLYRSGK